MAKEAAESRVSLPCVSDVCSWDVQVGLPAQRHRGPTPPWLSPTCLVSPQPTRPVKVQVKQLQGMSLTRKVHPSTTVWELKGEIEKEWCIPRYQQRLALQEKHSNLPALRDGDSLAAHGLFYDIVLLLLCTEPQEMEVLVKDSNKTTVYTVRPTDTVKGLKQQIYARQHVPVEQQRLTYETKELENHHTLEHYHVQPRSTIYLLLRLRGGAGPLPRRCVPS